MSDISSLEDTSSGSEEEGFTEQVSDEDAESENLTEIETIDSEPAIHSDVEIEEDKEENNNPRVTDSRPPPPSWEGKRLFPPGRKNTEPSKVWSFSGFTKDKKGQLMKEETICGLCGLRNTYRSSPSNLLQHLRSAHSEEFLAGSTSGKSNPKISSFFPTKPGPQIQKYKKDHPKQKMLRSKLTQWIVTSNRPMLIVEDPMLIEAFEIADPKFQMPTSWTVRKDINDEFEKKKVETIEKLSKVEHLTCTNDAGSSFGAKSFIDVNVHYVTEDFRLKKKVLDVMEMKIAKTAEN